MKHNKNLIRVFLIVLSMVMLLSVFAGCKKDDPDEEDPNNQQTNAIVANDDLPERLNIGREFTILHSAGQADHFKADESATDNVSEAIFKRNAWVEQRMGVTFNWIGNPDFNSADKNTFINLVDTDIKSSHDYDLVVCYNLLPYRMANQGLVANLNKEDNWINLEKSYWPNEYLDSIMYKDKIWALVDNCSVGTITNMSAVYFNNTLLNEYNKFDPYDLVAANKWTVDMLYAQSQDTGKEITGNGRKVDDDQFGIMTSTQVRITCWYVGAGVRLSNINGSGELVPNIDDEHTTKVIEKLNTMLRSDDNLANDSTQFKAFEDGRVLYYLCVVSLSTHMVENDVDINYGLVPCPKFTSDQTRYYTHLPNTHDAWCIPKNVKSEKDSSACIELMAAGAEVIVNPVFYENNLKTRYSDDERTETMYDLIRESISFDFLYIYKEVLAEANVDINSKINAAIAGGGSGAWNDEKAAIKQAADAMIQDIIDIYSSAE